MPLSIEKTVIKSSGHLVNLDGDINKLIEYIIAKKNITKDDFIKESIYRNVNYFMQHEDQKEEVENFVEPKIIIPDIEETTVEEKPKRKRRTRKKATKT